MSRYSNYFLFLFSPETWSCHPHNIYYKSIKWRLLWETYLLADATTAAVIHAITTLEEAAAAAGCGLSFCYSAVADAAAIMEAVYLAVDYSAETTVVTDVIMDVAITTIAVVLSSGF